jgi:hypothetical protein
VLGEMNCSCVGFSTQPELAHEVAAAAIRVVGGLGSDADGGACAPRVLGEAGSSTSEGSLAALEVSAA